ncbi:dephospho-CoA kinase [Halomonas denitrificans]|nr:dephospho-CoA kinase [Halomonas denitrificans]
MSRDVPPRVIALTGGIASGKTAVSDRFAALGVPVVDTDLLARDVVAPGTPGLDDVVEAFGAELLDETGALDRRALRERIFGDADARRRLESLLHPRIVQAARQAIERAGSDPQVRYVVLVVPLLVETGLFEDADRVLVVDVPETLQLERLAARDGVGVEQARAAVAAQATREQRLAVADDVIDNTGSLDALDEEVERLDRQYRALGK